MPWPPRREQDLAAWADNFADLIVSGPATIYGLLVADGAQAATLVADYIAKLATSTNPTTRTEAAVASKDVAKALMLADLKVLGNRILANPNVSAGQLVNLGLPLHDRVPSPVPTPTTKPNMDLQSIERRAHVILITDEATPTKRKRPSGCVGAEVFVWIGPDAPPASLEDWHYKGLAPKSEFTVPYSADDAGKTATIVSRWVTRTGKTGPVSNPISGTIAA